MTESDNGAGPAPAEELQRGTQKAQKLTCQVCGKVWTERSVFGQHYLVTRDGAVFCVRKPDCRARELTGLIGLDRDVWGRTPLKDLCDQMDVRPADWKTTGWRPKHTERERVEACIYRLSWCYPVCRPYACALLPDESDVIYDEHVAGGIRPATQTDIARVLNMVQQCVSRAMGELAARGRMYSDEDGRIYRNPAPPALTVAERLALYALPASDPTEALPKLLRGVPKHLRTQVASLCQALEEYAEESPQTADEIAAALSRLRENVGLRCSTFNDGLHDLRTARNSAIKEDCSTARIILPRGREVLYVRTPARPLSPAEQPTPARPAYEGSRPAAPNQQYALSWPAPYSEADVALAFVTIRAWQEHYPKIRFGAKPISIDLPEDRKFMHGLLQRLAGAVDLPEKKIAADHRPSDVGAFLPYAYRLLFPDPNSLGKAMPVGESIGILYTHAETYHARWPGNYGETVRDQVKHDKRTAELRRANEEDFERNLREHTRREEAERRLDAMLESDREIFLARVKAGLRADPALMRATKGLLTEALVRQAALDQLLAAAKAQGTIE